MNEGVLACPVCFHHCVIPQGGYGRCRARKNVGGEIVCASYGRLTSAGDREISEWHLPTMSRWWDMSM